VISSSEDGSIVGIGRVELSVARGTDEVAKLGSVRVSGTVDDVVGKGVGLWVGCVKVGNTVGKYVGLCVGNLLGEAVGK